jgi:hypothetical protein
MGKSAEFYFAVVPYWSKFFLYSICSAGTFFQRPYFSVEMADISCPELATLLLIAAPESCFRTSAAVCWVGGWRRGWVGSNGSLLCLYSPPHAPACMPHTHLSYRIVGKGFLYSCPDRDPSPPQPQGIVAPPPLGPRGRQTRLRRRRWVDQIPTKCQTLWYSM